MKSVFLVISVLAALITVLSGCTESETARSLDRAEAVMEEHPDSALAILGAIPSADVNSSADRALHALLLTQAQIKNRHRGQRLAHKHRRQTLLRQRRLPRLTSPCSTRHRWNTTVAAWPPQSSRPYARGNSPQNSTTATGAQRPQNHFRHIQRLLLFRRVNQAHPRSGGTL